MLAIIGVIAISITIWILYNSLSLSIIITGISLMVGLILKVIGFSLIKSFYTVYVLLFISSLVWKTIKMLVEACGTILFSSSIEF